MNCEAIVLSFNIIGYRFQNTEEETDKSSNTYQYLPAMHMPTMESKFFALPYD